MPGPKSVSLFIGISLFGVTGYLLYLFLKKENDDDYLSTLPHKSDYKTIKKQIPKALVRVLIGRNGKNIKLIQEQSSARIRLKDDVHEETHRVCIIQGTNEACVIAENLIQELFENQPVIECTDISVPNFAVGRIIGRCGEQIIDIKARSGAKINVSDNDRSEAVRRITLRGTQEQINIAKSLIEEIVERCKMSQLQIEATLAKREPRRARKIHSPKPIIGSPKVEQLSLFPGQQGLQFEVYVSAMLDPSCFWLQIVGPKATELDQLVEEMTEYYNIENNRNLHVLKTIERGDLVAAVFKFDEKWYRAEVLDVITENGQESYLELYYVDYGDTDKVLSTEVFELRTDFLRLNFQAIECYLSRIEPIGAVWSEEAKDKFEEWTHVAQWKKLSAKMNDYNIREKNRAKREGSPVPGVDLYDVSNDHDVDIAQELVTQGYAIFKKDGDLKSISSRTSGSNKSIDSNT